MSPAKPSGTPPEGVAQASVEVKSTVKAAFTVARRTKRPRSSVETAGPRGYLSAAARFIRAGGRRVAEGDEPELAELLALQRVLDEAVAVAVLGQKARGRSWAQIAWATNTTREAAYQRWGKRKAVPIGHLTATPVVPLEIEPTRIADQ